MISIEKTFYELIEELPENITLPQAIDLISSIKPLAPACTYKAAQGYILKRTDTICIPWKQRPFVGWHNPRPYIIKDKLVHELLASFGPPSTFVDVDEWIPDSKAFELFSCYFPDRVGRFAFHRFLREYNITRYYTLVQSREQRIQFYRRSEFNAGIERAKDHIIAKLNCGRRNRKKK